MGHLRELGSERCDYESKTQRHATLLAFKMEEEVTSQGIQMPSLSWKRQGKFILRAYRKEYTFLISWFSSVRLVDFKPKLINFCWFKC